MDKCHLVMSLLVCLFSVVVSAKSPPLSHKSSALYSPSCNEKTLKKLAGSALVSISAEQHWANNTNGYIVTLDTAKLTYGELTKRMAKANCFAPAQ